MRSRRKTTSFSCRRRFRRGFTLVELIVVLTILAILAAIAVGSAVSYIRKSRFDQNSEHAVTVYQAAQNALSQKTSDGTVNNWIRGLKENDNTTFLSHMNTIALDEPNESVNEVFSLTYNPSNSDSVESQELYALLSSYFYDMSIFQGTITVEFDVCATFTIDEPTYTARVISAFYSTQNAPENINLRWDSVCTNNGATSDGLPYRDAEYRYTTSFVGYYNGTEDSIKPRISSVFVPQSQIYELDGHIVGPTEDPTADPEGYLFNMRNGETLDVSWAIFDDDAGGASHDAHDETLTITLTDAGVGNTGTINDVVISIEPRHLANLRYNTMSGTHETVYETISTYNITRTTVRSFITVPVKIGSANSVNMTFPISVTLVEGDGRTGCPKDNAGNSPVAYYEYRISLDCMMTRSYDSGNGFNGRRLFASPTNIIATIEGSYKYYDQGGVYTARALPKTYAAIAIDDPVYYTGLHVNTAGHTAYRYDVRPGVVINDQSDYDHELTGEPVTGRCVVNTMFGDATFSVSSDASAGETIAATAWAADGKLNAVVTAFRHIYNIRWIPSDKTANYRIIRDLNWYINDPGKLVVSEVRVYTTTTSHSPATAGNINVVSFPAVCKLGAPQTLTSMSTAGGRIYSINNLQMRAGSFINGTDQGYGLVCINYGTVSNIYTNNLNLILTSVTDGSPSDYSNGDAYAATNKINPSGTVTISTGNAMALGDTGKNRIGGLVGYNCGLVGDPNAEAERNVIRMNNSIVLGGNYWALSNYVTGGVIGLNSGRDSGAESTYGVIELRGAFAVGGGNNSVGGIIGDDKAETGARLVVNGNPIQGTTCEYTLPIESNTGARMSCVVVGQGQVGAAIGWFENHSLCYPVAHEFSADNLAYDSVTGQPLFPTRSDNDFQVDVNLPANALILKINSNDGKDTRPVGGAIGKLNACTGTYYSIRVINNGSIIAPGIQRDISVGGAIGEDNNSSINRIYIEVNNGSNSVIGYSNQATTNGGPVRSGGAIGYITSAATGRLYAINADNNGLILSRGSGNGQGSGGAIAGAVDSFAAELIIDTYNGTNSRIIGLGSNESNGNGAGGAIGGLGNNNTGGTTNLTAGSVVFAENHGTISGVYHVGGAIGNAPVNNGKICAVNYGTITGSARYVGGAVGRMNYSNFGTVQSILNGATITGTDFVGGSVGRLANDQNGTYVKTIVQGSSEVKSSNGGSLIGGVCGDICIVGTGSDIRVQLLGDGSAPTLTVTGNDGVGGVAGIMRSSVINAAHVSTPNQGATNKLVERISGANCVGGAIGALRSTTNTSTTPSALLSNDHSNVRLMVDVSVVLNGESIISGTGSDVGGAIGRLNSNNAEFGGSISVTSAGYSDTASIISGFTNVGGAVGRVHNTKPASYGESSGITVTFTVDKWNIIATQAAGNDSNVGGAVGFFDGTVQTTGIVYPITVNLGYSIVSGNGRNVGGVIGKNTSYNGNVDLTSMSGLITGQRNVAGGIGYNVTYVNAVQATIIGTVKATGERYSTNTSGPTETITEANAGGAVGFSSYHMGNISATVTGMVRGGTDDENRANNVGGAIGYSYSNKNQKYWIDAVSAVIQGDGTVIGGNNVGGAIGVNSCNVRSVTSSITGTSDVDGVNRVGGAIGYASAQAGVLGGDVLKGNACGRIDFVSATISANNALSGNSKIGGAIGQIGNKWGTGNNYISAVVVRVEATINAGSLFDTAATGPDDASQDVCVGGVVGHFVDGRLGVPVDGVTYNDTNRNGVYLKGSGGVVHTPYPNRTYSGTVLMAAKGSTIGGIIGQLGVPDYQQNVCVTNISAAGGPGLCVMSTNGGNCVGGWIGAGYATHGGIGNENKTDNPVVYDVFNVRTVYSTGSEVGGFMGRLDARNGDSDTNKWIYATINVNLSQANVTGRTQVGGVFGSFGAGWYTGGGITVTLSDHSNIGDITGNAMPGDTTTYDPICYECGGAIGFVNSYAGGSKTYYKSRLYIPICVYSDATSRIWAGGTTPDAANPVTNFGVGGAFGRINSFMNADTRIEVTHTTNSSTPVYVYSAYSNVGGIAGVWLDRGMLNDSSATNIFKENITYAYANVNVEGRGTSIGVGGFAGRIDSGEVRGVRIIGSVTAPAQGSNNYAGGFAGRVNGGNITWGCTTATVNSAATGDSCTGGFIGYMAAGAVNNSYIGGHTFQSQYTFGEGNVTGINNVGGFVGVINGAATTTTISNCYSTASVLGSGQTVGGFVGNGATGRITNSYCSGLVTGSENAGTFAGIISGLTQNTNDKNQALLGVNRGLVTLVGRSGDPLTGINWATAPEINGSKTYTAHPSDTTLPGSFPLRAVINSEHYGDWSLGSSGDTSIENAVVTINSGDPDNPNDFPYRRSGVTLTRDNITVTVEGITLEYDEDYILGYKDNDRIGTATVQIAGQGEYYGVISCTFNIVSADISEAVVSDIVREKTYTGAPITPTLTVTLGDDTLVENVDYYFTYYRVDGEGHVVDIGNNTDIGRVYVMVHGMGNYHGDIPDPAPNRNIWFDIVGVDISNAQVDLVGVDSLVYTGDELTPQAVVVRYGGQQLEERIDYTISYAHNDHAGNDTAEVIITGIGSYRGTKIVRYSIATATNAWTDEPTITGWTWGTSHAGPSGAARFGIVEFHYYSDPACQNEVENIDQANAGTYYMKASVVHDDPEHPNDYELPVPKIISFTIARADIGNNVVIDPPEYVYTGQPIEPTDNITVMVGTRRLTVGTDYTITYPSDTTSVGTKPIVITGIGNYTGSVNASYNIYYRFDVTFVTGSGASQVETQHIREGDTATEPARPTFPGYSFHGWFTSTSYAEADRYDFSKPVERDITLYAYWIRCYTFTFVTGEGGSTVDSQQVDQGTAATRPPNPTRTGYTFRNWYTNPECTLLYDFAALVYEDRTLYAGWDPIYLTVTFDTGEGTSSVQVAYDTPVTAPAYPSREGYDFLGWSTSASEGSPLYDFNTRVTSSFTLYAQWAEQPQPDPDDGD
ncbi:MAG: InlB B-repeat-containing protein [Clostridiales bacterium]|nr:InlB B-repeat-containing protein [Clostridiales bacterium]